MPLAFHMSPLTAYSTESPRQGRAGAAIRQAAPAALAGAKQVAHAILVLSIFALMLVAAAAMGLLIWMPHFHVNW
jgi:hypothetical protein